MNAANNQPVAQTAATTRMHRVTLRQTGDIYTCMDGETVLKAMARLGKKGIPAGCLNGGCGVCKIGILSGQIHKTGPMSRAHVSAQEEAQGICLACRAAPTESIEIEVLGKMKKAIAYGAWGSAAT